jgi:hypothetical protein
MNDQRIKIQNKEEKVAPNMSVLLNDKKRNEAIAAKFFDCKPEL